MRNLKRALSLALASVMLLGMMVVGAGAASFPDVDDNDNVEAIEVLKATGVMIGDNGNFKPDEKVTRNEMAVIMTNLLGLNPNDFAGACPFTDVQPWAQNYVAACYANGIIAGRSATVFDGQATVTGVEAAAMMMRALGYFQYAEDYEGGFEAATVRQAAKIRLFDDIDTGANSAMDRNNVAQLALNSLKADTVDFTGTLGMMVDMGDGKSVRVGFRSEYTPLRNLSGHNYNGAASGHDLDYQQLAEKLYGNNLKLDTTQTDGSGRPANKWSYKYVAIGTYTKTPHVHVVVDKAQSLADEIKDINRSYTVTTLYVNGTSTPQAGFNVREGDVLDIYMDDGNANVIKAASITRYIAKQLTADAVTRNEGSNLEVRVPGVINTYEKADDVLGYEGLKKDDVVYYYQDRDGVYHLSLANSFEGQLTSIKSANTNLPARYVIDGKDYCVNENMDGQTTFPTSTTRNIPGVTGATPVYNTQYRYYTDANGYLVFAEEVESESKDYVVIQSLVAVKGDGSIAGSSRVEARLVKMDGTTEIKTLDSIKIGGTTYKDVDGTAAANAKLAWVDSSDGDKLKLTTAVSSLEDNSFYTYSVTSGKYALTQVQTNTAKKIGVGTLSTVAVTNKQASVGGTAVNNNTVFIVANESTKNGFTVYTGKDAVPTMTTANGAYVTKDGVATYVYIDSFTSKVHSGNAVFIMSTEYTYVSNKKEDGSSAPYREYHAIVNGEATTVKVKATDANTLDLDGGSASLAVGLFDPTYDKDGRITKLTANGLETSGTGYNNAGGVLSITYGGGAATSVKNGAKVWILNEKGEFDVLVETTVGELKKDDNDAIYVVQTTSTPPEVDYVFIRENNNAVVTLGSTPSTADVNSAMSSGGTVELPTGATVPSGVTVPSDGTMILDGATAANDMTVNGTLNVTGAVSGAGKVNLGANSTVNVAAGGSVTIGTVADRTATVNLNGGTLTVGANTSELPKITGSGTIAIADSMTGGSNTGVGDAAAFQKMQDFVLAVSGTKEGNVKTYAINTANAVKFTGNSGAMGYFDPTENLASLAQRTGGSAGDEVIFVELDLTGFVDNDTVKIEYVKNGVAATAYLKRDHSTAVTGTIASIKDGSSNKCTIAVTEGVTSVIVTKTA